MNSYSGSLKLSKNPGPYGTGLTCTVYFEHSLRMAYGFQPSVQSDFTSILQRLIAMTTHRFAGCLLGLLLCYGFGEGLQLQSDESLKDIACRSVHLGYPAPAGTAFYNEVTIDQSAPGTYFCVNAFNMGYCGLQELDKGKKVLLFSVWDPGDQNDPNAVKDEQRVKLIDKDPAVRIGRFGNEGTGGQSFFDLDWKAGETYRILITAKLDGDRTAYSCHLFDAEQKKWRHLATFSTLAKGKLLDGCYSFVEDFRRDRVSATMVRSARFGNGWLKTAEGQWVALTKARFTADANPVTNINAGVQGDRFYLTTGGETKNTDAKLNGILFRSPPGLNLPGDKPAQLPD